MYFMIGLVIVYSHFSNHLKNRLCRFRCQKQQSQKMFRWMKKKEARNHQHQGRKQVTMMGVTPIEKLDMLSMSTTKKDDIGDNEKKKQHSV
jgi:hypothetical protein